MRVWTPLMTDHFTIFCLGRLTTRKYSTWLIPKLIEIKPLGFFLSVKSSLRSGRWWVWHAPCSMLHAPCSMVTPRKHSFRAHNCIFTRNHATSFNDMNLYFGISQSKLLSEIPCRTLATRPIRRERPNLEYLASSKEDPKSHQYKLKLCTVVLILKG